MLLKYGARMSLKIIYLWRLFWYSISFLIYRKVAPWNNAVVLLNMLSITPKTLYSNNMFLSPYVRKPFGMICGKIPTKAPQKPISLKGACKVYRSRVVMALDMGYERLCPERVHGMKERCPRPFDRSGGNSLVIQAQFTSQSVIWLMLIKTLQDGDLTTQLGQAFLLTAKHISNIATRCLYDL